VQLFDTYGGEQTTLVSRISKRRIYHTLNKTLLVFVGQVFQSLPFGFRNKQGGEYSSKHEGGKNFEAGGGWELDCHIQKV